MSTPARARNRAPAKEAMVVFLCDSLEFPPRLGYQIHVSALARAFERLVPARALAWTEECHEPAAPWLAVFSTREAPSGRVARKRRYVRQALSWTQEHAGPGSVLWVRGYSTALLLVPFLRSARRARLGLTAVYDASSFEALEAASVLGKARGFLEERLWGVFDRVRTLSGPMRDYLIAKGVPAEKVLVIPVGAETRAEAWTPRATPARVLYVGGAADYQGWDALLQALPLVTRERPDVRLTIVGPDARAGAPREARFAGRVPHERVASFYLEHDLFLLPRPRTPLTDLVVPMKLPEAMSFGMPIVATDLKSVRWVLGGESAQLLPDAGPETLARGIREALEDPARLARWGTSARTRAAEFSWDAIAGSAVREFFGNGARP